MSYLLDGVPIRAPMRITESNSTQVAVQRTLSGAITRDYFGSNKRVWQLTYDNVKPADYSTIQSIYSSYLSSGNTRTWQVTESAYTIAQTSVHVDLKSRDFPVKGSSYISSFELILTEA